MRNFFCSVKSLQRCYKQLLVTTKVVDQFNYTTPKGPATANADAICFIRAITIGSAS
jgi:hypothetical protein